MARWIDVIQDAKCYRSVARQQTWDDVANRRENMRKKVTTLSEKQRKGQGVADLWEDTFEDAAIDGVIRLLEPAMKIQYVQGIASFTGTHMYNRSRVDQRHPSCSAPFEYP